MMNAMRSFFRGRRAGAPAIALIALALPMCARGQVTTVAVEGRSNENVTVAARGMFVALVWSASTSAGTDIYSAVSRDGGAKFSAPSRVNAIDGDARVGGEQPPRVVLVARAKGATPEIDVVWTSKGAGGTRLLVARSSDGGKSFGTAAVIPGGESTGNRGWESVAVDPAGRVFAMWLDHRNVAARAPAAMHRHDSAGAPATVAEAKADPVERAAQSQLFFAALDGIIAPHAITGGVCYCCKTSLVASDDRSVYGVWRHVFPGNQRDIGFVVSRDGGRTFAAPVRVSEDKWEFDGCPENGPAIAVDRRRRVHVVWPTPADGKAESGLSLFYAMSSDGRTFAPRMRVPTAGQAAHVQISASADGSLTVAWDELAAGGPRIKLARARPDAAGHPRFEAVPVSDAAIGVYPALAESVAGTVVAWVRREAAGTVIAVTTLKR
jgi:hypothetical protein